jgi:flagellar hook-basal body complex protein FliE
MVMNIADAVASAYRQGAGSAVGGASDAGGGSFADTLKSYTDSVVDTLKDGEKAANASVTGSADLTTVVTAVNNAEAMLQTVTAIRDKVISAYQSIIQEQI